VLEGREHLIGIPVCDEYLEKYLRCLVVSVPDHIRVKLQPALEPARRTFFELAERARWEEAEKACRKAMAAAKTATASYRCTW
jgi:hypothetical protein